MKKLMNSKKFEDYKSNEVAAAWAILGGEWKKTIYTNQNGQTCSDTANYDCYDPEHHKFTDPDDVVWGGPINVNPK